jgi:hypothetical protein
MTAWTSDELSTIGAAEELELASVRRDGTRRDAPARAALNTPVIQRPPTAL